MKRRSLSGRSEILRIAWVLAVLFLVPGSLMAGKEIRYPAATIPDNLKKNADLVVRVDEHSYEVRSLKAAVTKVHLVMTVLRESGLDMSILSIIYNRERKINTMEAVIYNALGMEINRYRISDAKDHSAIPEGTFYSEERVKTFTPVAAGYPFTVEYTYEISDRKLLHYPDWQPQFGWHVSLGLAELRIEADPELMPRFREENLPPDAVIDRSREGVVRYTIHDLPAMERERFSPDLDELTPVVHLAPVNYRTLGEDYDFTTWKSFGSWIYSLGKDRRELPEEEIRKVNDLVKGEKTELDKIRAIYRHLQQNTRYVNVSLGLGGFQPAAASFVAEKGYGDCKGLVNYTQTMMTAAGIRSYYTLILHGEEERDILVDFPSQQFNHVILCIPASAGHDTIWLECTSQSIPFGYIGSGNSDRHALLITPEGGIVIKTPVYPSSKNLRSRKIEMTPDTLGNASVSVMNRYAGLRYDDIRGMEISSEKEREEDVYSRISMPSATIRNISYKFLKDSGPVAIENIGIEIRSFGTRSGTRIFLPMNLFGNTTALMGQLATRRSPVDITYSFVDADTVLIRIPEGYRVEGLPPETHLSSAFGHYDAKTVTEGDRIIYCRSRSMNKGIYPPETFRDFSAYLAGIARQEKNNAVLIRK
jgi:hypothetical protein